MERYVPKKEWMAYAVGALGQGMVYAIMSSYISDFYMNVLKLAPVFVLLLMLLARVWDAVNDPIMGGIMDSRRISAKSKYKPWIRIGSFGLIVSGALAFLPIPHASYAMRVIVCVVTYLAWDIFYTLVNVPYGTLNSAISADLTNARSFPPTEASALAPGVW